MPFKATQYSLCSSGKGGEQEGGGKAEKSLNDFAAEYAKSNRSTCKGCEQKIEKVNKFLLALHPSLVLSPTSSSSNSDFHNCFLPVLHFESTCKAAFPRLRGNCMLDS